MTTTLYLTKLIQLIQKLFQKSEEKKIEIELILLRLNVNISAEYFYSSAKKRFPMLLLRLRLLKLEESVFLTSSGGIIKNSYWSFIFIIVNKKNEKL
jgi:hypothetical protein